MQNSNFVPGQYSRPPFQGKRTFVFVLRKWTKFSYSNAEFKNFPRDNTSDLRVRGEERSFSFSENVPKLSYSNAEFKHFLGEIYPGPPF